MPKHKNTAQLYYTDREVAIRFGVVRQTIWRWVSEGVLPSPVKVGPRASRWRLADIEAFEASLGKVA